MKKIVLVLLLSCSALSYAKNYDCVGAGGQFRQSFLQCNVSARVIVAYTDMFTGIADSTFIGGKDVTAELLYELRIDGFLDDLSIRCAQKEKISCEAFDVLTGSVINNGLSNTNSITIIKEGDENSS